MRVIAIANQKGGCGKTTTSINFSACLACLHKKVLIVDLDPQGHSTCGLNIHAEKLPYSLYDLLTPRREFTPDFSRVVVDVNPLLSVIPSYVVLGAAEEELANLPNKEKRLKQILDKSHNEGYRFDYVIIDCPPNLGILTLNALEVADEVLIPIEPSFFSLHGLAKISETIAYFNKKRNDAIQIHALLTLFDSETNFGKEIYDEVKRHFHDKLFKTIIHTDIKLKEAVAAGKNIIDYDSEAQASRDYLNLAVEYLERDWNRKLPEEELGWGNIVRQRLGPRRVLGGVLFQATSSKARTVEIAGDFNHWVPEPMLFRDQDRIWQRVVPMNSGNFRYKFIVDGEWQLDPFQPARVENSFGCYDSYLELV